MNALPTELAWEPTMPWPEASHASYIGLATAFSALDAIVADLERRPYPGYRGHLRGNVEDRHRSGRKR